MGKNVTSVMTSTLGSSPNPNHMIMSGAMAMMGSVWEATSRGMTARRSQGTKSTQIATSQPNARETPKPTSVTSSVARALCHSAPRLAQPWSSTRAGEGSSRGSMPLSETYDCHAASRITSAPTAGRTVPTSAHLRSTGRATGYLLR